MVGWAEALIIFSVFVIQLVIAVAVVFAIYKVAKRIHHHLHQ